MTKRPRDKEELMMKNSISLYLDELQNTLRHDEGLITQFVTIMRELLGKEIDCATAESRVKELFKDHDNLLVGFNDFLPKKKKKNCIPDKNLTRVFDFMKRVRVQIFLGENLRYSEFLNHVMSRNNKSAVDALDCNPALRREYEEMVADSGKENEKSINRELDSSNLKKPNPNDKSVVDACNPDLHREYEEMVVESGKENEKSIDRELDLIKLEKPNQSDSSVIDVLNSNPDLHRGHEEIVADSGKENEKSIDPELDLSKLEKPKSSDKSVIDVLDSNPDLHREYEEIVADSVKENEKPIQQELDSSNLEKPNPSDKSMIDVLDFNPDLLREYGEIVADSGNKEPAKEGCEKSSRDCDFCCKKTCIPNDKMIQLHFHDIKRGFETLLSTYEATETKVDELLEKINEDNCENVPIDIRHEFTSTNLKCIARLYGIGGLHIIDLLFRKPRLSLPLIVIGLKEKIAELRKPYSDFNIVSARVMNEIEKKSSKRLSMANWIKKTEKMEDKMNKEYKAIFS